MEASRWQRVEELFLAAQELEEADRGHFLDDACGDDHELRKEIESLLAASPVGDERLGQAVAEVLEAALEDDLSGTDLGAYKLLRKIGEGGLATVYLAERADRQYRMQVAVKVVKQGMATADILRRLRQERQILATLQHPNIARLLDGGTTPEGRPYFVMEFIDGEPIDEYCDQRQLTVVERLELFRTVCSAVHHAHQNLIIHRDIKPSNVLVSSDGIPKLLDFGIAKLLRPDQAHETVARTVTGLRLLTPEYASPEQVRGEPLTTATDIYSLGVLFYRLLTGRHPYRFESSRPQEIERVICDDAPERPSTIIWRSHKEGAATAAHSSESLRRRLTGDLDNIVLMALRKEPGRRYASVEQFSEDVGRHLTSRPVIARPDTFSYRTGKFIRRHRGWVTAATALLVVLIGGIIATTRATLNANAQRARAEHHLAEARQVTRFLIELFENSDPGEAQGNQVTAREILDGGSARIAFELADQPVLRAELMSTMGRVYQNLGLLPKARELLEQALDERRRNLESDDSRIALSLGEVGGVISDQGDYEVARELLEEALALQRRLGREDDAETAVTLDLLAAVVREQDDLRLAAELCREALEIRTAKLGQDHPETLESLNNLAEVFFDQGDLDSAEALFRQTLALRLQRLGPFHPDIARTRNNLAVVLDARGDYAGAETEIREVLALRQKIYGDEHPAVAVSCNNLAAVLLKQGLVEEAEERLRQALEIYRGRLGEDHPRTLRAMGNLAVVLRDLDRLVEAEELLVRTLEVRREAFGEEHPDVARNLFQLATLRIDQGRSADAIRLLEEVLQLQRRVLPPGHFDLAYPLLQLAELWIEQGDCSTAEPLLQEAIEIQNRLPPEHPTHGIAEEKLADCQAS